MYRGIELGIVTCTELESVRRCGWRWMFGSENRMYLESASPLRALERGTLWHLAMDSMAQREMYLATIGEHTFVPTELDGNCNICNYGLIAHDENPLAIHSYMLIQKVRAQYKEVADRNIAQTELYETNKSVKIVNAMMANYLKFYGGKLIPEGFRYVQTEQQVIKVLPETNHCTCYLQEKCACAYKVTTKKSCRYKHSFYTHCKCESSVSDGACSCREDHYLEGKLDGIILHLATNNVYIWENKTFSVHPNVFDMPRTSQFMGYDWLGHDLHVAGMVYNGVWVRDEVPTNKQLSDLFVRRTFTWSPIELKEWVAQAAVTALQIFDPNYVPVRVVHPVGGCNGTMGCDYKTLCDARFLNRNYEVILKNEYRKRTS